MDLGDLVFYDNFFWTVDLAKDLLKQKTYLCATARSNRCKFPKSSQKTKLSRGKHRWVLVEDSQVQSFVWQDKKPVNFINTVCSPKELTQVKRKNKDGSQTLSSCSVSVKQYNKHMGGVDTANAKHVRYSVSRWSQKWWHTCRLFCKHFRLEFARVACLSQFTMTPEKRLDFQGWCTLYSV